MINKRNISILLLFIIPLIIIGLSNYFFAASSYRFIIDPETMERTGRYWVGDIDGLLMAIVMSVIITAIWVAASRTGWIDKVIYHICNKISYFRRYVKLNRKKVMINVMIIILILCITFLISLIYSSLKPPESRITGIRRYIFFIAAGLSIHSIVVFRSNPERLFVSLSLILGFMYILANPTLFFGMDNEMHYAWSVEESYLLNVSVLESDYILAHNYQHGHFGKLPSGEHNAVIYSFSKGTETLTWSDQSSGRNFFNALAHLPSGIAIYFGRSLALSPNIIVFMGIICNHLLYTAIVYFAIKRMNSGKYLMATIALLPTSFIISTSYGYDAWLTSFLMLGFSYYYHEMQNPTKTIKQKNAIIMIGAFIIGMASKAVYFPIMLLLYCLRKNKFKTTREYKRYIIIITLSIILVIASFAIPFILGSSDGGGADERGGESANSSEQIAFIFQNPLIYTGILLKFMIRYLNIFIEGWYISYYGSFWYFSFPNLLWLLILFTSLTDNCEKTKYTSSIQQRLLTAGVIFTTIAIFTTAMYIGFTNVGSEEIAGVQKRYLIALLFPFFYVISKFNIINNINKTLYSSLVFSILTLALLNGAWQTFIY